MAVDSSIDAARRADAYNDAMVGGIILAAGASSRMGRTKALLPSGNGQSFLGRLVAALREGGADPIAAVVGHAAAAIEDSAARDGLEVRLVSNPVPDRGQLSSLLVALDVFDEALTEAVVVIPVDLPLVSADTVRRLIAAWRSTAAPIARPSRDGRHGHPVLFAARLFAELRAANPGVGAREVVRAHAADILDVPVDDMGAFDDIDTPEDYARLIGPLP